LHFVVFSDNTEELFESDEFWLFLWIGCTDEVFVKGKQELDPLEIFIFYSFAYKLFFDPNIIK